MRAMIIGVGIDIVETERVEKVLERHGGRFASKIFTPVEREYSNARKFPHVHYAARFAAKEAFVKAVGLGMTNGMRWQDIGIVNDGLGKPELTIEGKAATRLAELGVTHTHVSLSHTHEHATAVVILEQG
jgi:holo-[acyl-carrier protein] synthase